MPPPHGNVALLTPTWELESTPVAQPLIVHQAKQETEARIQSLTGKRVLVVLKTNVSLAALNAVLLLLIWDPGNTPVAHQQIVLQTNPLSEFRAFVMERSVQTRRKTYVPLPLAPAV